jgi:hypothetical protein
MDFDRNKLITILVILLIIWFVSSCYPSKPEHFYQSDNGQYLNNIVHQEGHANSNHVSTDISHRNHNIKPMLYEPELGLITSASDFIGLPDEVEPAWSDDPKYGDNDALDDGAMGNAGLNYNLCSPSCCSPSYPTPFEVPCDDLICKNKHKFVPSSYKCSNSFQNSGCACVTEQQNAFLSSRGGNGINSYDVRDLTH